MLISDNPHKLDSSRNSTFNTAQVNVMYELFTQWSEINSSGFFNS